MGQLRRRTQLIALRQVSTTLAVAPAVDGVCSLFLSLPCSTSLSVERGLGRAIRPHYYQLSAELCTVTADHQLDLCLYRTLHRPKLASSTIPEKPPTTYMPVNDFRPHRDLLFRGATYTRVYTVPR